MTPLDPADVRKAAALVEKLGKLFDEFGARVAGSPPIRFRLIGRGDTVGAAVFEAVPVDGAGPDEPTDFGIGFVR